MLLLLFDDRNKGNIVICILSVFLKKMDKFHWDAQNNGLCLKFVLWKLGRCFCYSHNLYSDCGTFSGLPRAGFRVHPRLTPFSSTHMENLTGSWECLRTHVKELAPVDISMTTACLGLTGIYVIYLLIYGFFLSPTRHLPGPFLSRFGPFYFFYCLFRGFLATDLVALHQRYGRLLFLYL